MIEWQPIETAPENEVVRTKIDNGENVRNDQPLIRRGNLWYLATNELYVYYRPTHWTRIATLPSEAQP